jgi:excisionase family DNA binding protein
MRTRHKPKKILTSLLEIAAKQSYSVDDFARLNSISRSQAFKEIHEGKLKVFRVGKRMLISPEAVREWQTANTPEA